MRLSLVPLALIPALLFACGGERAQGPHDPNTLTHGISNVVDTLDPVFQTRALDGAVFQQIMEPLVWYNDNLELIPWLATSWEAEEDGRIWNFHLKEGVTFHCGTPFNADAVVAHFRRILDTPGSTRKNRISSDDLQLLNISATDEHTVRFEFDRAFAPWPEVLRDPFAHIVCPHCAAELGENFTEHPCGTGPFMFREWRRGQRIVMARNPNWHGGTIHFENLVFRPIQEQTTRLLELLNGNLDSCDISWTVIPDVRDDPRIVIQTAPSLSVRYIAFNTQKPPFDDVRVRRAANHAVDQQSIVDSLLNGIATVSRGPLPEALPAFNPDVRHYDYDPDLARQLLAEAGYPDGVDVEMWASDLQTFSVIAQAVAEDLRQVGIRVNMRVFDKATYWDHFDEYIHPDGSWEPQAEGVYDMCIAAWLGGESAFGFLWPLLRSHSYSNSGFYDNSEVDEILYAMLSTPDPDEYLRLVRECQRIVVDDAPWIFCNHGVEGFATRPWVQGYHISSSGEYRFGGVRIVVPEEG
ncbi:ABC transporter substrate-binding protein [Candidatus Sumerlaeota bacterium]|nr:ABC transporter substrate-binding protein [Candidatus Sumerlaeota bacterium]